MATMSMLGALLGFGLFGFLLRTVHAYGIYCFMVVSTVFITRLVAREKARDEAPRFAVSELIAAYSIDVVRHSDFFWVFVTRVFYYMGISLQAFVLFMLRDVQRVDDPTYYTSRTRAARSYITQLASHRQPSPAASCEKPAPGAARVPSLFEWCGVAVAALRARCHRAGG